MLLEILLAYLYTRRTKTRPLNSPRQTLLGVLSVDFVKFNTLYYALKSLNNRRQKSNITTNCQNSPFIPFDTFTRRVTFSALELHV